MSTRTEYGLPDSTILPGGATTATTHDGATRVDESDRFPLTATDEAGRVRRFVYDALGGLAGATDLGGVAEWSYDYDPVVAGDVRWDLEGGRVWIEAPEASDDVYRFTGAGANVGPAPGEDAFEDRSPGGTIDQDGGRREMAMMAADAWRHGRIAVDREAVGPGGEVGDVEAEEGARETFLGADGRERGAPIDEVTRQPRREEGGVHEWSSGFRPVRIARLPVPRVAGTSGRLLPRVWTRRSARTTPSPDSSTP